MKFTQNGPNIPTELIAAQESGDVVFVCGAGASMLAGLPSFKMLVERIYQALGETWENQPAEDEAMALRAFDRALRCLERRLGGTNPKAVLRIRERIREAVRENLRPTATTYPSHLNILRLSRDAEMRHRVVTTNFDPLFEKAWAEKHPDGAKIASHAGASMPGPQSAGFIGVLHLHGRLGDKDEGLEETDLILTSAEFGEAYLRSGWAARYVYDLVRALSVVIVGYSADDPPMRYLLEVIDADRERFRDLRKVYAFVPSMPGDEARQIALWDAKGATPIPYTMPEGGDHSSLYDSLEQWAAYAEDPTKWRQAALQGFLANPPEKVSSTELQDIEWLLSGGDAAEILRAINPAPSWLQKLTELKVLKANGLPHLPWITANLSNMEMLEACLNVGRVITADHASVIDLNLNKEFAKLNPVVRTAWRLLSRAAKMPPPQNYELGRVIHARTQIKAGEVNYDAVKAICAFLRPRLSVRTPFTLIEKAVGDPPARLGDVIRVEFESSVSETGIGELTSLLAEIPQDSALEIQIIGQIGRELVDALEEAVDATFTRPEYDHASHQVPSIAPHDQNQHARGFYFLVRALADLWARLAQRTPDRAADFTQWALNQPHILLQRIGLEFLTYSAVHDGGQACAALMALPDETFWRHAKREVMRLMAVRWGDMPVDERNRLEVRLIAGPPASLYPGIEDDES